MNAPLPKPLRPELEVAIAAAVAMIKGGADPAQVLRVIHELGYTSGTLDMAALQQDLVANAFRKML